MARILALVTAVALLAAACGAPEADPQAESTPTDTVRLVTHDSFAVSDDVLAAFTEQTGLTVEVVASGDAGAALNQAILTAGDPQGDVFFGVDNTFLSRALDSDVFVPYESPRLSAVPDEFELDPEHRVTPIDRGDVCLNYDVAWFEEHGVPVPETLAELTQPVYEGLLVVSNPATSSPGLAFLAATVAEFGEDWAAFWEDLAANDVAVASGWEDAYYGQFSGAAGSEGDRPLVVSYASSPPAEVFFAEDELERAPTEVIPASCFRQIEFAAVLAGTPHTQAAHELIDFMLSERFQEDIPLNMFVFPVVEEADLPEVFVEYTVVPDDPLSLPPETIGENREDWIETWTDIVIR